MKHYERMILDKMPYVLNLSPIYSEGDNALLVNGMLGKYKLWVSKADRSVTPCLTGEFGGMPGAWENWITSWHTKNFEHFDTYIDVGANSGYFAFLANHYGLKVIACEANPEYVELLSWSKAENDATNVEILAGAITDYKGSITLTVPEELHGGASTVYALPGKAIEVWCATLDSILIDAHPGRTLIKIDVEGAEPQVFAGASAVNALFKPTYIMEYTPRQYDDTFYDQLAEYGRVTQVDANGGEQPTTKEEANSADDWITLVVRPR